MKVAHEVWRLSKGSIPTILVDRHPFHVIRTELYEIGLLAVRGPDLGRWAVPIERVVGKEGAEYLEGAVDSIDLEHHQVLAGGAWIPYGSLAVGLGNVPAYYGVPGAAEHLHQVYGLLGAIRLADELKKLESAAPGKPRGRHLRVVVVGGGATGTEVAAEIATADWASIAGPSARAPKVTLVCGALPFLDGFDRELVEHARHLLREADVELNEGSNVTAVRKGSADLANGTVLRFDVGVWAAGLEAPAVVKALPVAHGRGGRISVPPTLEVPGHPGVFAVGDVAELKDPETASIAPATAQVALAEAPVAAENILRRRARPLLDFRYREKGSIVSVGRGRASARWKRVAMWGGTAGFLKSLLEREYRRSSEAGR